MGWDGERGREGWKQCNAKQSDKSFNLSALTSHRSTALCIYLSGNWEAPNIVQSLHLSYSSVFAITTKRASVFPHLKLTTEQCVYHSMSQIHPVPLYL